jgi:RNA polymerase sigma factor (sigma-70 family)
VSVVPVSATDELGADALCCIEQTARRIAYRLAHTREDREDLIQDLIGHALAQRHAFEAARGSLGAFLTHILRAKAADLAKAAHRQRRGGGRPLRSLQEPVISADGEPLRLEDSVPDAPGYRLGQGLPSPSQALLAVPVRRFVDSLPPSDQDLCRRLLSAGCRAELAVELGISRKTLYQRLARLRARLQGAGIEPA